ncbi:anaerobic ribonucleoside-triphosphate reductase activating protein [Brevibacillus laterosporus]|nr:anaerobic ribonucleoside-triphosphate reductase activating protein [Brevibacillus laterosporus]TPG85722.1 anaerobic ribonucleoside-triphosphate reductase activating protein [Brevibacillus laterosporus]
MHICDYRSESINEGIGLRAVVFVSGCRHACPGCFNPESWDFSYGQAFTPSRQQEVIQEISTNPLLHGMTLCGGDPFFSADACISFVTSFRNACPDKTVWAYTGFTFEALLHQDKHRQLLELCDVIIDGKFKSEEKDTSLRFRGSRNQRIIDVKKSLSLGAAIEWA